MVRASGKARSDGTGAEGQRLMEEQNVEDFVLGAPAARVLVGRPCIRTVFGTSAALLGVSLAVIAVFVVPWRALPVSEIPTELLLIDRVEQNDNADGGGGWQAVDTHGKPGPRDEGGSFQIGDQMCLFGGRGWQAVSCFDPATCAWKHSRSKTDDLHHVQPVVYRDEVWIVAGYHGAWNQEKAIKRVVVYNPADDTLRSNVSIPTEFARGAAGVVVFEGHFYIAQGSIDGHISSQGAKAFVGFTKFDPKTGRFTDMGVAPRFHRDHFQAALSGSRMVLAAGRDTPRAQTTANNQDISFTTAQTEWFDLTNGHEWQTGRGIPHPTAGNSALSDSAGRVLVIGGEGDAFAARPCQGGRPGRGAAYRWVQRYDPGQDEWEQLPQLINGEHTGAAALISDSALYVAAGVGCAADQPPLSGTEVLIYTEYSDAAQNITDSTDQWCGTDVKT